MAVAVRRIYSVDTGSLIYCQHSFGSQASRISYFASVWSLLDRLADDARLQAPHLVFVEITRSDDHIARWAKAHPAVFRPKGEHAARVVEILKTPGQQLVKASAPRGAEEADPWVIALAEAINATQPQLFGRDEGVVVTEERKAGGISDVCEKLGITCVDVVGMLQAEGLTFGASAPVT